MAKVILGTQAQPAAPSSGQVAIYPDESDGLMKQIDSDGVVTPLGGSQPTATTAFLVLGSFAVTGGDDPPLTGLDGEFTANDLVLVIGTNPGTADGWYRAQAGAWTRDPAYPVGAVVLDDTLLTVATGTKAYKSAAWLEPGASVTALWMFLNGAPAVIGTDGLYSFKPLTAGPVGPYLDAMDGLQIEWGYAQYAGGNKLHDLHDPDNDQDAATKKYVDQAVANLIIDLPTSNPGAGQVWSDGGTLENGS